LRSIQCGSVQARMHSMAHKQEQQRINDPENCRKKCRRIEAGETG